MAEPEPETNGEPQDSNGSDEVDGDARIDHLFWNHTPYAEPQYDFGATFGIWWDLHCYGLGAVFVLICIFAVRSTILMLCRKHGKMSSTKPFLVFINVLVVTMCLLRGVYLFVDPYNQKELFPVVVNNIIFNVPFPCMTTCFAMILWVLREVGQVRLSVRSRSRSLRALFIIAVTHLGLVIIVSAIIELTRSEILLLVMCHGFFVLWELFLCLSAVVLMYRISRAVKNTGKTLVRISKSGRSPTVQSNLNDVNMNIGIDKAKATDMTDEPTKIENNTSPNEFPLSNTYNEIKLSNTSVSDPQNIDAKYEDMGEIDVKIVKSPSQRQLIKLDPVLLYADTNLDVELKGKKIQQESSQKLSLDQKRNKTTLKLLPSSSRRKPPGTNIPPVRSTFADMTRRARLTRKVTRITVVTTVTSFTACILNLLFVLSLFPGTDVLQKSEYWVFIFWTCFRVTEIAMACVILYFIDQPMSRSSTSSRSIIK